MRFITELATPWTDEEIDQALSAKPTAFRCLRKVPLRMTGWYLSFVEYWIHMGWGQAS